MDIGTFLGFLIGVGLFAFAVLEGGNPGAFFHTKSIILVVGGIVASAFIRFPLSKIFHSFIVATKAFFTRSQNQRDMVMLIVSLSHRARREGLLALEDHMPDDKFLAMGLRMIIDHIEPSKINDMLNAEIQATLDRHNLGQDVFRFIATTAPSFGMVGTLFGMVQLFANAEDPGKLAAAMALSLLSTLWGAVIAYLFALPIAGKLELRSQEEAKSKILMREGIFGIHEGMTPSRIEEHLNAFLAPKQRIYRNTQGEPIA